MAWQTTLLSHCINTYVRDSFLLFPGNLSYKYQCGWKALRSWGMAPLHLLLSLLCTWKCRHTYRGSCLLHDSIYMHWCNSISNPLLFTWVKATLVILEEGNCLRAEDSCSRWRPCGSWVPHFLSLRAPRVFKDINNELLQTRSFWSQELSVVKLRPLLTGLIYIFCLLYRISIWG